MFEEKYNLVEVRQYATLKKERVSRFLKSIEAMAADYICVADINNAPCVTARKQSIQEKLGNIDRDATMVVIREIEGWYLAGLDDMCCRRLKVSPSGATDALTKEEFDSLIPRRFDSRIDFMSEILKCFSLETAKQKNGSFRYFVEKHSS